MDNSSIIKEGDTVIVLDDRKAKMMLTVTDGQTFQNKSGAFHHAMLIGQTYGSKIWSKSHMGYIHVLKPNPYLITETVAHKTQILFQMDISMILLMLDIRPGRSVVESGTGSGSLTSSIAQALKPSGRLFTYEFNKDRAENGQQLMTRLKYTDVVTNFWRDVYGNGFLPIEDDNEFNQGKTFPNPAEVEAIFLDLPQPWQAFEHAKRVIVKGGRICSFSPCIEQVQRSCTQLKEDGWKNIETYECLKRHFERRVKTEISLPFKRKANLVETDPLDQEHKLIKADDDKGVVPTTQKAEHTKKVFYSAGIPKSYGHTGFLTFATYV